MTLFETEERLKAAGIENFKGEAKILVCHFEDITPAHLLIERDRDFTSKELEKAVLRREKREPLQYIIGKWDFMNETYIVDASTLIPRADTETLVMYGIENIPADGTFADLCTGSGCVAVSTLAGRPDLTGVAVEKYSVTLETAKKNAELNGVSDRLRLVIGDVRENVFSAGEKFDAVLTNPPYVTLDEYNGLAPEVMYEPRAALTDEGDGLSIIKKILEIYPACLKENGFIAIEIGSDQSDAVKEIAASFDLSCEIIQDIENRDRVCVCRKNSLQFKQS